MLKNIKHRADIGLAFCFLMITLVLMYVAYLAPIGVSQITFYDQYYSWVLAFIPAFISGCTVFIFLRYMVELNGKLSIQAHTDTLSGLANRRSAFEQISKHISFIKRKQYQASLIMMDIDNFKNVNDEYGHIAGDEAIKVFAQLMQDETRKYDVACRYGGEEFLLFLPDTTEQRAYEIAERIRTKLENTTIENFDTDFSVTASMGVTSWNMTATIEGNIEKADKALYQAKKEGRNKAIIYSS